MLPIALVAALEKLLDSYCGKTESITATQAISGGCINRAAKIVYGNTAFFVKWNNKSQSGTMFETEAAGLQLLASAKAIGIPAIVGHGKAGDTHFLVLEYIEQHRPAADFWEKFGLQLAALHGTSQSRFGLGYTNTIGSLPQSNRFYASWPDFFRNERLNPMILLAENAKRMDADLLKKFELLYSRLDKLFPPEKPALLHGDLWSGNFLCSPQNLPFLIDPAAYYGNREADLAMSLLFGGFDKRFYEAYHHAFPLEKGWQERANIFNLYPLLVHALLFGESYLHQIRQNLNYILR